MTKRLEGVRSYREKAYRDNVAARGNENIDGALLLLELALETGWTPPGSHDDLWESDLLVWGKTNELIPWKNMGVLDVLTAECY